MQISKCKKKTILIDYIDLLLSEIADQVSISTDHWMLTSYYLKCWGTRIQSKFNSNNEKIEVNQTTNTCKYPFYSHFLTLWFVLKSFRSNHPEMSWKKAVLKIFKKLHKETPEIAGLQLWKPFQNMALTHVFPIEFFYRTFGDNCVVKMWFTCDQHVIVKTHNVRIQLLSATNSLMCHNIKFHYMTFLWSKKTLVTFPKKYSVYFHNFFNFLTY